MKSNYRISGMHCRSCELLVAKHLRRVTGVTDVRVDHAAGEARVTHDAPLPHDAVAAAVHDAGYTLGNPRRLPWLSRNPLDWQELLVAGCIVFVLFLLAKVSGLSSLAARAGTATGPVTALIVGLTAGVSTCMALIGGLVLGISARHAELHPEATALQKFRPHLFFNGGRILGFALLGGLAGAAGALLRPSAGALGFFIILAGIFMLAVGVKLLELFPRLSGLTLPAGIGRALGLDRETREYGHLRSALTGALTFFLPCGFTQAMQVYAVSTGSFAQGALVMAAFALGTAPGLLGVGGLASALKGAGARMFFKATGIIVILLGLWNVSNGWTLTGVVIERADTGRNQQRNERVLTAQVRNGKQYVSMTQSEFGYSADRVIVKRGIPVVWEITSTNSYTCASSLNVPTLDIAVQLQPGQNTIEFLPERTGLLRFSCSMGMFKGIIEVVE